MNPASPVLIVLELLEAAANQYSPEAERFARIFVHDIRKGRPELCGPMQPCAPPPAAPEDVDADIDQRIDDGSL